MTVPMLGFMAECRLFPLNENYRLWTDGRVESCLGLGRGRRRGHPSLWHPIKPQGNAEGYLSFTVRIDGKKRRFSIHRAVLISFVGPCPEGMECRHLDDDPANNQLSNLCWGTPLENAEDKVRNEKAKRKLGGWNFTRETHTRSDGSSWVSWSIG
jgi:hypothetical protein